MKILLVPVAAVSFYLAVQDFAPDISRLDEFKKLEITYSAQEYTKRAGMGDAHVVNLFLEKGMSVDSRDNNGATALMRAAENGHLKVIKLILSKKADMNATDKNGYNALMVAAEDNRLETVKTLINAGLDVNEKNPASGVTALMIASVKGNADLVAELIKGGAKVNETDNNGYTPLMLAAENGHMDIVKKLVESGADRKIRNRKWHVTASYIASYNKHQKIASYLKRKVGR